MSALRIRKAVIPAAGYGTRFLPAAKAVPKEMMCVADRPVIQWIVEEALTAGVDEVVIVTSPRKDAITAHFRPDTALNAALRAAGRTEALSELERLDRIGDRVRFVMQTEQKGLGHAVLCAAGAVGEEPFLVLLGDALVCGERPAAVQLVDAYTERDGGCVIGLEQVPMERVSRYGVVAGTRLSDRLYQLSDLVEKPTAAEAPSDLAIAGRYILTPEVFAALRQTTPGRGGEIQLTDAIRAVLPHTPVYGLRYTGRRYDIGNPVGYLEAAQAFAQRDPRFQGRLPPPPRTRSLR
ncbi:MAG: hypothetical protein A3K19_06060 [Lentisphaerae bacterium RIFOXYB12_FULL_65_16]|nr:MAG: hypothetical protein A3K18_34660 [Lentisphaerae bacterium RIFOXYA12_64_32]OGV94037.1 MAG: hypothetical protein A3K19_06060 [Lentisphaerae bacterium RIFOXYB12_FULL_65_16]